MATLVNKFINDVNTAVIQNENKNIVIREINITDRTSGFACAFINKNSRVSYFTGYCYLNNNDCDVQVKYKKKINPEDAGFCAYSFFKEKWKNCNFDTDILNDTSIDILD